MVLDFGCGSGVYALSAARLAGAGGKVYAQDKDANALETLSKKARKKEIQNIETIHSSDLGAGLPDGSVDVVLMHDVLHMIDKRRALFDKVSRVLDPGGRVSIYPMHVDKVEVARQMGDSGFSLLAEEYEGNILVFQKAEAGAVSGAT